MTMEEAINYALEEKAILFAGSGFCYGAKNIKGESFRTGDGLRDCIADECNVHGSQSTLSAVSDYYKSVKGPDSLITFLISQFSLGTESLHHDKIMSIKWKRVYTTNYDEIIETAAQKNGRILQPVVVNDPINYYDKDHVCVHLNGYIKRLNKNTLDKEFKLTNRSYDSGGLIGLPWYEFMLRDFKSAKSIIIVGFSMESDMDIRQAISSPEIFKKVVFISSKDQDPVDREILKKYATVENIGVEEFANRIDNAKKKFIESPKSFDFISFRHSYMNPLESENLSFSQLIHFYYNGYFSNEIFAKNRFNEYKYVLFRNACDLFLKNLYDFRVFIATSGLGNGKTTFCYLVRNELRQYDIDVFTYVADSPDIDEEIKNICTAYGKRKRLVIIDDFYGHIDILRRFHDFDVDSKVIFLLTARQSKISTNFRLFTSSLDIKPEEVFPIPLQDISWKEGQKLAEVLKNNNLIPEKLSHKNSNEELANYFFHHCHRMISSIVLDFFESSYIKNELTILYNNASSESASIQELTIIGLANNVMRLSLTFTEMLRLLNIDYVVLMYKESQILNELFDIDENSIKVRSSIISQYFLYSIFNPTVVMNVLLKVALAADKMSTSNLRYEQILIAMMSHSNFIRFSTTEEGKAAVLKFYDDLRNSNYCKKNPFFWEQFASAAIDSHDFPTAKQCLETAFVNAARKDRFVPFQVSTVYGNYLVEQYLVEIAPYKNEPDTVTKVFTDVFQRLTEYYDHPENNHYYVFKVTHKLIDVYQSCAGKYDSRQLSIILEKLINLQRRMEKYKTTRESGFYPSLIQWSIDIDQCVQSIKDEYKKLLSKG